MTLTLLVDYTLQASLSMWVPPLPGLLCLCWGPPVLSVAPKLLGHSSLGPGVLRPLLPLGYPFL